MGQQLGCERREFIAPLISGLLLIGLSGCFSALLVKPKFQVRQETQQHGWRLEKISDAPFVLTAYHPKWEILQAHLTIYIEGDGLAWRGETIISTDPTPNNPLALRLAMTHTHQAVAYLVSNCII